MTVPVLRADTTEDPDNRSADFTPWLLGLLAAHQPTYLVCIARGALRAIQLLVPQTMLPEGLTLISNDALPFLPESTWQDAPVLVFDDSVIYGSTISDVVDYLQAHGARVTCASYVVDRETFFGDTKSGAQRRPSPHARLPLHFRYKRWADGVRAHHARLVERVLESPLDYNTDFPSLRMSYPPFQLGDLPYLIHRLEASPLVRRVENVSHPMAVYAPTVRYTMLLNARAGTLFTHDARAFDRGFIKCRLTITPSLGDIRIAPVVHLGLNPLQGSGVMFAVPRLQECWLSLTLPTGETEARSLEATHRLVGAVASLFFGRVLVEEFATALMPFGTGQVSFDAEQMSPILGPQNSAALAACWQALAASNPAVLVQSDVVAAGLSISETPLSREVASVLVSAPELTPSAFDTPWECVGRVFLALRQATDSPEKRAATPAATRLRVGLTFEEVCSILNDDLGLGLAVDDISIALDMYVDSGLVVPKIVLHPGGMLRAFYSGENEENQPVLQLKGHLHRAYVDYVANMKAGRSTASLLSRFDIAKLCVALKYIIPTLPVALAPRQYGFVTVPVHDPEAPVNWLFEGPYAPFSSGPSTEGSRVVPGPGFLSPVAPAWPNDQTRSFQDAFAFLAHAFSRLRDDPKLLLTTCRTHRHAFNAVAWEAHAWVGTDPLGFGSVLAGATAARGGTPHSELDVGRHLYWCFRFLSEARRKEDIFYNRFEKNRAALKTSVTQNGKDAAATRWWAWFDKLGILDPSHRPELELRWSRLRPLLALMELLTGYATGLLLSHGLLALDEFKKEFVKRGTRMNNTKFKWIPHRSWVEAGHKYNSALDADSGLLPTFCTTRVATEPTQDLPAALQAIAQCFGEVRSALLAVCPLYKTEDPAFPFAPEADRRLRADGVEESRLDHVFVLAVDIIGSTGTSVTREFRDRIRAVFASLQSKGLIAQSSGDDCLLACARDPKTILAACKLLADEGQAYMQAAPPPFGGTRKAIGHGSIVALRNAEWVLFEETSPASTIAQVTSMLGAVDANVPNEDRNGTIVMDERTFAKCGAIATRALTDVHRVQVEGKHFFGFALTASLK